MEKHKNQIRLFLSDIFIRYESEDDGSVDASHLDVLRVLRVCVGAVMR